MDCCVRSESGVNWTYLTSQPRDLIAFGCLTGFISYRSVFGMFVMNMATLVARVCVLSEV